MNSINQMVNRQIQQLNQWMMMSWPARQNQLNQLMNRYARQMFQLSDDGSGLPAEHPDARKNE